MGGFKRAAAGALLALTTILLQLTAAAAGVAAAAGDGNLTAAAPPPPASKTSTLLCGVGGTGSFDFFTYRMFWPPGIYAYNATAARLALEQEAQGRVSPTAWTHGLWPSVWSGRWVLGVVGCSCLCV